jgi:hypothetical protein
MLLIDFDTLLEVTKLVGYQVVFRFTACLGLVFVRFLRFLYITVVHGIKN